jgi:hypothetical protein
VPVLPVAVLDSSVLVPRWSRVALQQIANTAAPAYVPFWSEWIVAETWRVLTWRRLARSTATSEAAWRAQTRSANTMLRLLLRVMRMASLYGFAGAPAWPTLRDLDDLAIWHTALVAGAQYVVSHNLSDFPPLVDGRHVFQGIEYLTAIEFIEDVLGLELAIVVETPVARNALLRSRRAPRSS